MGKRKCRAKPEAKKRVKLETVFTCPFCGHSSSVQCAINRKIATAKCSACEESYTTFSNSLTEPIDVYSEWIDECERVNSKSPA